MDPRRAVLALAAGALAAGLVVWAFFATFLPVPELELGHPWRGTIPFLAVFLAGVGVGRAQPRQGLLGGLLVGLPGAFLGGVLGLLAALRPRHLVLLLVLVATFVALAIAGVRLGARWVPDPRR